MSCWISRKAVSAAVCGRTTLVTGRPRCQCNVSSSRESPPARQAFRPNLMRVLFEPGLAFCLGLQTTTVAGPTLRVMTIQAALTAKLNRDQPEKPPIFKRIRELPS